MGPIKAAVLFPVNHVCNSTSQSKSQSRNIFPFARCYGDGEPVLCDSIANMDSRLIRLFRLFSANAT